MRVDIRVLGMLVAVGAGLVITGLIVGGPNGRIEGAYFQESAPRPMYSGVFTHLTPGLLNPSDGNLWLGAGIAILLASSVLLLVRRRAGSH